jgi:outer membrane protein OmpA-like peptidoglycan-associated protein
MKKILSLTLLIICFTISSIYASDLTHKVGLGAGIGFPIPLLGNHFNDVANPEWEGSLYGRYHFDQAIGMELGVSQSSFKETSMNFRNINLLGLWRMAGSASLTPVLGAGLGITDIKDYTPRSAKLSLLGRLGFNVDVMKHVTIDAMVDYQYVSKVMGKMPTGAAHVLIPQLAMTWYFGSETQEMKTEEPAPKEKVTDVVSSANSATQRKSQTSVRKANLTVEFDSSKSDIKNEYKEKIKKIAARLNDDYNLHGIIIGHADSTGPSGFNMALSIKRAAAVKKALIEYGVSPERLNTEGLGEDRPIASNKTKEGRQKNRRAAVYISVKTKSDLM